MVLLIEKFHKLYSKLDNHHHHQSEAVLASSSLQAFQSDVSNCLNQFSLNYSKPGSEILSFPWVQQLFAVIPFTNKAFAKLVADIDYPISKWEVASVEEYLNYSLNLLELFNSITSSLSFLGQARLSLSHALSLVESSSSSPSLAVERLKEIQPRSFNKDFEDVEERICSDHKESVIHEALAVMRSIGFWVCGIVLSGLYGDSKPYLEMRKSVTKSVNSSVVELDSRICEFVMEKKSVLKEVKELNDAVSGLVAGLVSGENSEAAKELQRKLEVFEKLLEGLGKEVDHVFSKVLAGRNESLDCLRYRKQ